MSTNIFITDTDLTSSAEGILEGKTIAVKDNISTAGIRTTCGSQMLEGYIPPYNATVIERVLDAGATIVGKSNMDEFGMGNTTETSHFGPTDNPAAPGHVPGGSSGGSAAAIAAGEADLALGSDTGGSIRCPAAFCDVVGLKPSYGRVSRYGLVAYANSLEQIGPFAPSVEECARLLDVIAGNDPRDATTVSRKPSDSYVSAVGEDVSDLTIGIPEELLDGADDGVLEQFWRKIETLEDHGVDYHTISLPSLEHAVEAYYVIAMSEASSNLARFDGVRFGNSGGFEGNWNDAFGKARETGFGAEVKRRILLGTYALSAGYHDKYYKKAQDARAWIENDFDEAFQSADLLASPTMPIPPFKLGEEVTDPLTRYLIDANTVPVNLANVPAISVPAGTTGGLPVGLQLIGPKYDERTIISAASAVSA